MSTTALQRIRTTTRGYEEQYVSSRQVHPAKPPTLEEDMDEMSLIVFGVEAVEEK